MNSVTTSANRQTWLQALLRPQVLDRAEQAGVVVLFSFLCWRMLDTANPFASWAMASEFAVLVFVLLRRPTQAISVKLGDWLLACTATFAPLMIRPAENHFPELADVALFLLVVGNVWQIAAKLILRRSFGIAPANRGIKISGPYRYMRHPIYAGYLLVHLGLLAGMFSWYNLTLYAVAWTAQIYRLLAEERLLSQDPVYADYMGKVRWRLLPGIF